MRLVTSDDIKKQLIFSSRIGEKGEEGLQAVHMKLKDFGAVEMENKIPFVSEEAKDLTDDELFDKAIQVMVNKINFQLRYVAHITGEGLS